VAAKGMLGDLNPLGDGPCRSLADNGARVPNPMPPDDVHDIPLPNLDLSRAEEGLFCN